jgi:hypothetical protein
MPSVPKPMPGALLHAASAAAAPAYRPSVPKPVAHYG